jgi:hypothetical protein
MRECSVKREIKTITKSRVWKGRELIAHYVCHT